MAWYWWVLIVVAAVLIGWLKMTVFGRWMARRKEAQQRSVDEEE